jgi:glycosyltransferase involved in cell wall biosynthesis
MRVLAISAWWPEPADNGSRQRIAQLLGALTGEHEVHLAALAQQPVTPEQQARLAERCASVEWLPEQTWTRRRGDAIASLWQTEPASVRATWNPAFAALVQRRAAAVRPQLVIAFQLGAAPYAGTIAAAGRVLEEVELTRTLEQFTRQRQPLRRLRAWLTWRKHRGHVQRLLGSFDACTVVSAAEQAAVRALAPAHMPIAIIPNGADVAGALTAQATPEPDTLIYPGALSYDANYDAMLHFVHAILPRIRAQRPQVRLRITGWVTAEQQAALAADGVEWTGYVPDVRPLVARAWSEVVPLRLGGGTRLKVLEALALGTPVVSTSKGVEGLELEPEQHLLLADTPAEFARATLRLLAEPALRARLAVAGRQIVRANYDWRQIGGQLNQLLAATVTARGER